MAEVFQSLPFDERNVAQVKISLSSDNHDITLFGSKCNAIIFSAIADYSHHHTRND